MFLIGRLLPLLLLLLLLQLLLLQHLLSSLHWIQRTFISLRRSLEATMHCESESKFLAEAASVARSQGLWKHAKLGQQLTGLLETLEVSCHYSSTSSNSLRQKFRRANLVHRLKSFCKSLSMSVSEWTWSLSKQAHSSSERLGRCAWAQEFLSYWRSYRLHDDLLFL